MTSHRKTSSQTSIDPLATAPRAMILGGSWLIMVRAIWLVVVLGSLALFAASLPPYFALLSHPCTGQSCPAQTILVREMPQLHALGISLDTYAALQISFQVFLATVCIAVGTVIFWRKSHDPMALLSSFTIAMFGMLFDRENLFLLSPIWTVPVQLVSSLSLTGFCIFFYLFPNGQFVPRWTRWLVVGSLLYWLADIFFPVWQNSLLNFVIFLGFIASMLGTQVYRYREVSSPRERQQTKWVVLGAILGFGGYFTLFTVLAIFLGGSSYDTSHPPLPLLLVNPVISCLVLLFPLSIGFAILRSRLWDIDVIINRTLVYGSLTVILALVYAGLVLGLQTLLSGLLHQTNAFVLVVSTLVIAGLFQPLRRRIQRIIDRRFYRRKYDAAKTIVDFSATLRNEVDLNQLSEHLITVVQETMQPAHVSLWLRPPAPDRKQQTAWSSTPPVPPSSGDKG